MTNAVTVLDATSYVDPAELAALPGLAGVIPANMGDTAGTLLGIFQGYQNSEVPFGGTSGLANVVPVNAALAAVQPPLMNWSGNATLSSATALTTPQEFFLGSQYTAVASAGPMTLSSSNRWGQITYPNIRFGYKQPGDIFIARRVWWRIPVVYQTAGRQTLAGPGRSATAIRALPPITSSLYTRFPLSFRSRGMRIFRLATMWMAQLGQSRPSKVSITGSIYGSQIQLSGGTYNGVSSRQQVNVLSPCDCGRSTLFEQHIRRSLERAKQLALTHNTGRRSDLGGWK